MRPTRQLRRTNRSRNPPTKKETNRPERNRPNRSNGTSNTPNQNIERINPNSESCTECPSQVVTPGKISTSECIQRWIQYQYSSTNNAEDLTDQTWVLGDLDWVTLSFASDYVDGGAYQDGGLGMSLGFRLIPQFEIEGSYGHYTDSTLESSRNRLNRPIQLVVVSTSIPRCRCFSICFRWIRMEQHCD